MTSLRKALDFQNDSRALAPINDPQHWRFRAEEMRTIAEGMQNESCRNSMLRNAACYDRLAERAEERTKP